MPRRKCVSKDDRTSKVDYSLHKQLLEEWRKVADVCASELRATGYESTYADDSGRLHTYPQIDVLKTASVEIRALIKDINDHGTKEEKEPEPDNALADVLRMYETG